MEGVSGGCPGGDKWPDGGRALLPPPCRPSPPPPPRGGEMGSLLIRMGKGDDAGGGVAFPRDKWLPSTLGLPLE